ncbi:MAG: NAD-binding protein [Bacteroidales bacterium]|nr:NAD-binding protein [Bacteroidales bacterium]
MRYLILGLGIYGSNLARDLTDAGAEVIGVDNCQANIEAVKDYISTVYLIDVTEESALTMLPLNNVDLVIVTIGENFGASIKVVAMLKKLKVKHIYARAIDTIHEAILEGFHIDRIITPEQRAARDLTFELGLGTHVQTLAIDPDTYVLKFAAPKGIWGNRYAEIPFQKDYGLTLITITHTIYKRNLLGIKQPTSETATTIDPGLTAQEGDQLVCLGSRSSFFSFFKALNEGI